MANTNVVLGGELAGEPIVRHMPSGDKVTELRVSCSVEPNRRELPLPCVIWHKDVDEIPELARGDQILLHGRLVRRFYRSGAGARSIPEVLVSTIQVTERKEDE